MQDSKRLTDRVKAITLGSPPPCNPALEVKVLMLCAGPVEALATVMGYLVPEDFFDPDNAKEYRQKHVAYTAASPESREPVPSVLAQCKELRKLTASRQAIDTAWKLVLEAHAMNPCQFCDEGIRLLTRLKEGLNRSQLNGQVK